MDMGLIYVAHSPRSWVDASKICQALLLSIEECPGHSTREDVMRNTIARVEEYFRTESAIVLCPLAEFFARPRCLPEDFDNFVTPDYNSAFVKIILRFWEIADLPTFYFHTQLLLSRFPI
jgi:hypothetical protein